MIMGISMSCLPRKYEVTPYIFEPYSLRKTALSAGNVNMIENIGNIHIEMDIKNKAAHLSYLSWNLVGSLSIRKYMEQHMNPKTKYWYILALMEIGFLKKCSVFL